MLSEGWVLPSNREDDLLSGSLLEAGGPALSTALLGSDLSTEEARVVVGS